MDNHEKNEGYLMEADQEYKGPFTYKKETFTKSRLLFAGQSDFVAGVEYLAQLPSMSHPEIAFIGRSNVGKSSLINALVNRKMLARTSHTPGRTQQLNFFNISDTLFLVDLPGYGYAKVSKSKSSNWVRVLKDYLSGRQNLHLACLLIDARHGLKPSDLEMIELLDETAVSCQIVLTKCDKVKPDFLAEIIEKIQTDLKKHPSIFPYILTTSSHKKEGIELLQCRIFDQIFPNH